VLSRLPLSESKLLYDWRSTADQFILTKSPLRLTTRDFIFQRNTCGYCPYVTSSLTRGWVCRLQFLALPSQSFSGASPARVITTIYCLKFETSQTRRVRSPYLYRPGNGWPSYVPRHWVPLSSLPTTRKATVEISDPASTLEIMSPLKAETTLFLQQTSEHPAIHGTRSF
jgi:hypothetical protein